MNAPHQPVIRLSDYRPPDYLITSVDLRFVLDPVATRVEAKISFQKNWEGPQPDLRLDGRNLKFISASIDQKSLSDKEIELNSEGLIVPAKHVPSGDFLWEAAVEINPKENTALEGLYLSKGLFATQCEAQGFRKITYFLDRPDVMARYRVEIVGDYPVKLSNGNPLGDGVWEDPWPKPSYLFALVAGDLVSVSDEFRTASGRNVTLKIYVRDGDKEKCAFALQSLKKAMRWDEEVYGLEYDLDLFQIVAVNDFNMGAMENKGLNIFNAKYVLATSDAASDRDFELIEGIIAHEYFHNWTGNRITCRDWFQLSLKEGLTVFRDQEFTGDMRGRAVKRIDDVLRLRAVQFSEDRGPLAHPVRPNEYIEINNFYTATVYEKGAELIRMLKLIVGDAGYFKALALYFKRHDGQACTIEDWLSVFEDACDISLEAFKNWYEQAGTPSVHLETSFKDQKLIVDLRQDLPLINPDHPPKPMVLPIKLAGFDRMGQKIIEEQTYIMEGREARLEFEGLSEAPILSLNRGFSTPCILHHRQSDAERLTLLEHDDDALVAWDAGYRFAVDQILDLANAVISSPDDAYLNTLIELACDTDKDPNYRSYLLQLPGEAELSAETFARGVLSDPSKIHLARNHLERGLSARGFDQIVALYHDIKPKEPYAPEPDQVGRRRLSNRLLELISLEGAGDFVNEAYENATNMTDRLAALSCLIRRDQAEDALAQFYEIWAHDPLVIDKWFAYQLRFASSEKAVMIARNLSEHPAFDFKNPNRFRALTSGLTSNHAGFHRKDGAGYRLLTEWLRILDPINPQITARVLCVFETWKQFSAEHQAQARASLEAFSGLKTLSKDSREIIDKICA